MSCPNLKTYNEVRLEKLNKINTYHTESLLQNYVKFTGSSNNDTVMKKKYKDQLDILNKKMLTLLANDVQLLLEQNDELNKKSEEVKLNKELLKDIKSKLDKEIVNSDARLQNTTQMTKLEEDYRFYHNVYFYSNLFLFIIILIGLMYIYLK